MLALVLVLLAGALGLLIAALAGSNMTLAWVSVVVGVIAGLALALDWLRHRRAAGADRREARPVPPRAARPARVAVARSGGGDNKPSTKPSPDEPGAAESLARRPARVGEEGWTDLGRTRPGEETTEAADLQVVSGLDQQVTVVPEQRRYHLDACQWVGRPLSFRVPVSHARRLGFTPCATCTPDAALVAEYRLLRRTRRR